MHAQYIPLSGMKYRVFYNDLSLKLKKEKLRSVFSFNQSWAFRKQFRKFRKLCNCVSNFCQLRNLRCALRFKLNFRPISNLCFKRNLCCVISKIFHHLRCASCFLPLVQFALLFIASICAVFSDHSCIYIA